MAETQDEEAKETQRILNVAEFLANPTAGNFRKPPRVALRKQMLKDIREGVADRVDKRWLLEEYLNVFYEDGCKIADKKAILDSICRLSGYGAKTEEPADEKEAIMELMRDMESKEKPSGD